MARDTFMLKLNLREPGYTFSGCVPFTKLHQRSQKFRETCNLKHIYKNELDKACFIHGTAYSNSKDLAKRTILDKVFFFKLMKLLEILSMMGAKQDW